MFEVVNQLARRLPHPEWTGDPMNDRLAIEQYAANGRRLRSEAFRCMGRGLAAWFRGRLPDSAGPIAGEPSHQA